MKETAQQKSEIVSGDDKTVIDPVCKMQLSPERIKESLIIDGQPYYFCSIGCRAEFQRHPEDYIRPAPKGRSHV